MNHSTYVLDSGNNKINISQSVLLIEFNRQSTIMKAYLQVNRTQISFRKRGKKIMMFGNTERKGTTPSLWPPRVSQTHLYHLLNQTCQFMSTLNLMAQWEHLWILSIHTTPSYSCQYPELSCRAKSASAQPLKGESSSGIPTHFQRAWLPHSVSLCQMTIILCAVSL